MPLQSHHILESLSRRGHKVRVIDYEARWKPDGFLGSLRRGTFNDVHRTDPSSSVCLIRPGMVKLPGISRLSSATTHFKEIFEQIAKWCDVVVLYSVPTNGIQTVLAAKLFGKPVLFHSFDVLHRMTGYRLLSPPTWTFERFVYKRVDKVIVISATLENYMLDIGVSPNKVELLPPAVNIDRFNPLISGREFRKEIGLSEHDKVVLFSGWLYEFCGLDLIVRSWAELAEAVPRLKLVICGHGPLLDVLKKTCEESELRDDVRIIGKRPFDDMPSIIASSDLCINPYLPDVRSNFAFPSKLAEYMASGKPILATDLPGTRSLLPSSSGVVLVPPSKLVGSLKELLLDENRLLEAGRMAREFCERTFSLKHVSDKFEQILFELSDSPTTHAGVVF